MSFKFSSIQLKSEYDAFTRSPPEIDNQHNDQQQTAEEEKIKEHIQMIVPKIDGDVTTLNEDRLKYALSNKFYDGSVMHSMMLVTNGIIYGGDPSEFWAMRRVRDMFSKVRKIGEDSKYGVALAGDIGTVSNAVIMKAPREEDSGRDIIHELFIGLFGTNQLRNLIPNFAYIYGGFNCTVPFGDKPVYCSGVKPVFQYVLYESVLPSYSLHDYVKSCSESEYLNILLQLLHALNVAHEEIDFTHYDLHSDNILVRDVGREVYIPFTNGMSIRTRSIATIIDFGFAHMIHEGTHYGISGYEETGIYPDRSFPMQDIVKVLTDSLNIMYDYRNKMASSAERLLAYFTDSPPREIVKYLSEHWNGLMENPERLEYKHTDLISFILENFDCSSFVVSEVPSEAEVMGCGTLSVCKTVNQALKDFGLRGNVTFSPRNYAELYDEIKYREVKDMNVDVRSLHTAELTRLSEALRIMKKRRASEIYLKGMKLSVLKSPPAQSAYIRFLNQMVAIKDFIIDLDVTSQIGENLAYHYGDPVLSEGFKELVADSEKLKSFFEKVANRLYQDQKYVNDHEEDFKDADSKEWYYSLNFYYTYLQ